MSVPYLSAILGGPPTLLLQPVFSLGPLAKDAERRMKNRLPVLSYAEPEVEARIDSIGFDDALAQEFVLETGSLGEPMEALRQCGRELTRDWKVTAGATVAFKDRRVEGCFALDTIQRISAAPSANACREIVAHRGGRSAGDRLPLDGRHYSSQPC